MRILLIGGTGQLGAELHRSLEHMGEVIAPARAVLDLSMPDSIASAVTQARPRFIVNAAAYTRVDEAESEPDIAMKVNGTGPRVLAHEAARAGAALIHYSTDYVFDGSKETAYREDDSTGPINVYGKSKLAGERAVLESPCAHLVFRTSWLYGLSGRNFLLRVVQQARTGASIEVVDDQFGAPTPARSIAECTAGIMQRFIMNGRLEIDRMKDAAGLYHMSAAGRTSWHGFAVEILRELKLDAVVRAVASVNRPSAARRPRNSVLDNTKLRARFSVSLPDWRSALSACLRETGSPPEVARVVSHVRL
jgi:dTDP-4-dehydrorhamnose reductase